LSVQASFAGTLRTPTNTHQSPAWLFIRTTGNGARVKSTVFVSTRAAVIGKATVGRTGNSPAQVDTVSFRGRLIWRPLYFERSARSRSLQEMARGIRTAFCPTATSDGGTGSRPTTTALCAGSRAGPRSTANDGLQCGRCSRLSPISGICS
jgi:hypothetical protein